MKKKEVSQNVLNTIVELHTIILKFTMGLITYQEYIAELERE